MDERAIARFWAKIDVRGPGECWEWTAGNRGKNGYGRICIKGKGKCVRAHRLSWELANGPIPAGLDVLHKCDNPPCVNPAHLFLGTNLDNIRDRQAKGRSIVGEKHGGSVLTESKVRKMRSLRPGVSYQKLADRFGCSIIGAWKACNYVTWKHVV